MSEQQLVEAYVEGRIGRRTFIRRLVATGVSMSAAVAYTHLLNPSPAAAEHVDDHYESPAVVTTDAVDLAGESAILTAQVDPNRLPTSVWFEYGETTAYGSRTPNEVISGNGFKPVGASVTGLDPGRAYHFRAVAANSVGQTAGQNGSFAIPDPERPRVRARAVETDLADVVRAGRLRLIVESDEAVEVSLKATMGKGAGANAKPRRLTVARGRASLDAAGSEVATLRLTGAGRRALKRLERAELSLRVSARDLAGNQRVSKRGLKLS